MAKERRQRPARSPRAKPQKQSKSSKQSEAPEDTAPPPLALSNVSDVTIRRHCRACHSKKAAADAANGEYRSALKAAKADGVDPSDVTWYIATKKRDAEEVNAELRRRARVAETMDMGLDLQPSLFPDPAAAKVGAARARRNNAGPPAHVTARARTLGRAAGAGGISKEACPYPGGSAEADAWSEGWGESQAGIVKGMAPPNGEAAEGEPAPA
jgi:ribosome modulation factor